MRPVLLTAVLAASPALAAPELPTADQVLLSETFRLATELGEEIWPGWGVAPWEVLLVGEEQEFLVNSPRLPEGFDQLETFAGGCSKETRGDGRLDFDCFDIQEVFFPR